MLLIQSLASGFKGDDWNGRAILLLCTDHRDKFVQIFTTVIFVSKSYTTGTVCIIKSFFFFI